MEEREEQFLKNAFRNLDAQADPHARFNSKVFQKIYSRQNIGMQILHSLRITGPVLFICLLAGIFALIFKGDLLITNVVGYLPMLKPWHIFMAFIIIYFHFVRSVLILAFLYFKKLVKESTGFSG